MRALLFSFAVSLVTAGKFKLRAPNDEMKMSALTARVIYRHLHGRPAPPWTATNPELVQFPPQWGLLASIQNLYNYFATPEFKDKYGYQVFEEENETLALSNLQTFVCNEALNDPKVSPTCLKAVTSGRFSAVKIIEDSMAKSEHRNHVSLYPFQVQEKIIKAAIREEVYLKQILLKGSSLDSTLNRRQQIHLINKVTKRERDFLKGGRGSRKHLQTGKRRAIHQHGNGRAKQAGHLSSITRTSVREVNPSFQNAKGSTVGDNLSEINAKWQSPTPPDVNFQGESSLLPPVNQGPPQNDDPLNDFANCGRLNPKGANELPDGREEAKQNDNCPRKKAHDQVDGIAVVERLPEVPSSVSSMPVPPRKRLDKGKQRKKSVRRSNGHSKTSSSMQGIKEISPKRQSDPRNIDIAKLTAIVEEEKRTLDKQFGAGNSKASKIKDLSPSADIDPAQKALVNEKESTSPQNNSGLLEEGGHSNSPAHNNGIVIVKTEDSFEESSASPAGKIGILFDGAAPEMAKQVEHSSRHDESSPGTQTQSFANESIISGGEGIHCVSAETEGAYEKSDDPQNQSQSLADGSSVHDKDSSQIDLFSDPSSPTDFHGTSNDQIFTETHPSEKSEELGFDSSASSSSQEVNNCNSSSGDEPIALENPTGGENLDNLDHQAPSTPQIITSDNLTDSDHEETRVTQKISIDSAEEKRDSSRLSYLISPIQKGLSFAKSSFGAVLSWAFTPKTGQVSHASGIKDGSHVADLDGKNDSETSNDDPSKRETKDEIPDVGCSRTAGKLAGSSGGFPNSKPENTSQLPLNLANCTSSTLSGNSSSSELVVVKDDSSYKNLRDEGTSISSKDTLLVPTIESALLLVESPTSPESPTFDELNSSDLEPQNLAAGDIGAGNNSIKISMEMSDLGPKQSIEGNQTLKDSTSDLSCGKEEEDTDSTIQDAEQSASTHDKNTEIEIVHPQLQGNLNETLSDVEPKDEVYRHNGHGTGLLPSLDDSSDVANSKEESTAGPTVNGNTQSLGKGLNILDPVSGIANLDLQQQTTDENNASTAGGNDESGKFEDSEEEGETHSDDQEGRTELEADGWEDATHFLVGWDEVFEENDGNIKTYFPDQEGKNLHENSIAVDNEKLIDLEPPIDVPHLPMTEEDKGKISIPSVAQPPDSNDSENQVDQPENVINQIDRGEQPPTLPELLITLYNDIRRTDPEPTEISASAGGKVGEHNIDSLNLFGQDDHFFGSSPSDAEPPTSQSNSEQPSPADGDKAVEDAPLNHEKEDLDEARFDSNVANLDCDSELDSNQQTNVGHPAVTDNHTSEDGHNQPLVIESEELTLSEPSGVVETIDGFQSYNFPSPSPFAGDQIPVPKERSSNSFYYYSVLSKIPVNPQPRSLKKIPSGSKKVKEYENVFSDDCALDILFSSENQNSGPPIDPSNEPANLSDSHDEDAKLAGILSGKNEEDEDHHGLEGDEEDHYSLEEVDGTTPLLNEKNASSRSKSNSLVDAQRAKKNSEADAVRKTLRSRRGSCLSMGSIFGPIGNKCVEVWRTATGGQGSIKQ